MGKRVCVLAILAAAICFDWPTRLHAQAAMPSSAMSERAAMAPDMGIPAVSTASAIEIDQQLQNLVQRMLDRSPYFRTQWGRINTTRRVHVGVRFALASEPLPKRALTRFARSAAGLRATVIINVAATLVEVIGHEFEHVLEQIEGLDLKKLVRMNGSGVTWEDPGYETRRAIAAGERVLRENRRGRQSW